MKINAVIDIRDKKEVVYSKTWTSIVSTPSCPVNNSWEISIQEHSSECQQSQLCEGDLPEKCSGISWMTLKAERMGIYKAH